MCSGTSWIRMDPVSGRPGRGRSTPSGSRSPGAASPTGSCRRSPRRSVTLSSITPGSTASAICSSMCAFLAPTGTSRGAWWTTSGSGWPSGLSADFGLWAETTARRSSSTDRIQAGWCWSTRRAPDPSSSRFHSTTSIREKWCAVAVEGPFSEPR